jgi:PilZ domain
MTPSSINARRWRRYHLNLPVHVIVGQGSQRMAVSSRGTELSRGGVALHAYLSLQPGDPIEVDFQTPSKLQIAGIIRNRIGYRFGMEFLTPLLS